jgi:hypothetical protein
MDNLSAGGPCIVYAWYFGKWHYVTGTVQKLTKTRASVRIDNVGVSTVNNSVRHYYISGKKEGLEVGSVDEDDSKTIMMPYQQHLLNAQEAVGETQQLEHFALLPYMFKLSPEQLAEYRAKVRELREYIERNTK